MSNPRPRRTPLEPKVVTDDVARLLERHLADADEDVGDSVQLIAERAHTSTRTVYRVLSRQADTLSLDLADRLLVAVGEMLADCRVIENGTKG